MRLLNAYYFLGQNTFFLAEINYFSLKTKVSYMNTQILKKNVKLHLEKKKQELTKYFQVAHYQSLYRKDLSLQGHIFFI